MTLSLRPDDLAIDRLHIRAPTELQQRLQQELSLASWPRTQDDSWVFIRRLEAKVPAQQLSHTLVQATRDSLGKAKSPNQQSDVVRFGNYFEMLAYLLNDLALEDAASHWYWQRWKHLWSLTPSNALSELLSENLTELPLISHYLHQQQSLTTVWHALNEVDADKLLNEFCRQLGLQALPPISALTQADKSETLTLNHKRLQPAFTPWQTVFSECKPDDPRVALALMTIALQLMPLALQHNPHAVLGTLYQFSLNGAEDVAQHISKNAESIGHNSQQLNTPSDVITGTATNAQQSVPSPSGINRPQQTSPTNKAATGTTEITGNSTSPSTTPSPSASRKSSSVTRDEDEKLTDNYHQQTSATEPQSNTNEPLATPSSVEVLATVEPLPSGNESFQTTQGGLLYLLNFLNRSEVQTLMGEHWQRLPNGWAWLYRLGQTLQLDENDPLVGFICQQLGFDSPSELHQLAPLPAADKLEALATRWYAKTDVWHPQLLKLDARIEFNPSHLDLHTNMNSVQLAVRLAGLDINPGWLPWLGRVVSFHYDT